jgi:hypothetical protein
MPRTVAIGQQTEGINLRRYKGGADPSGLYDLLNAWVTPKGTIKRRPGTMTVFSLGVYYESMRGLYAFNGKFHTFTHFVVSPSPHADLVVNTLRHPDGGAATLAKIHRVFAFLGRLYVVAEFTDGVIKHYYLETPPTWTGETIYNFGDRVQPQEPNGFYYEVTGLTGGATAPIAWQPNVVKVVGDYVQPTVPNGFKYRLNLATWTTDIRTSNHEPNWPLLIGGTVVERRYVTEPQVDPGEPIVPDPSPQPPPGDYGPFPPHGPPTVIR